MTARRRARRGDGGRTHGLAARCRSAASGAGLRRLALAEDDLHAVARPRRCGRARGSERSSTRRATLRRRGAELRRGAPSRTGSRLTSTGAHRRAAGDVLEVDHQAVGVAEEEVLVPQRAVGRDGDGELAVLVAWSHGQDARRRALRGRPGPAARRRASTWRARRRGSRPSGAGGRGRRRAARGGSARLGGGLRAAACAARGLAARARRPGSGLVLRVDLVGHEAGQPDLEAGQAPPVGAGHAASPACDSTSRVPTLIRDGTLDASTSGMSTTSVSGSGL